MNLLAEAAEIHRGLLEAGLQLPSRRPRPKRTRGGRAHRARTQRTGPERRHPFRRAGGHDQGDRRPRTADPADQGHRLARRQLSTTALGETPHRRWSRWKNCCFAAIRPPDRLDGLAFVYTDRYSRRVSTILGYPTSLLAMDRNFQKFLASVRQNPWRPDKNNQQTTFQLNGRQQRSRFGGPLHSVRNRFGRSPRHSAFAVAQAIGLDTKL